MPDKCPDIYQSTISFLSCFFSLSTQLLTIHHCLWSLLSKCLLSITQVFQTVCHCVCVCCVHGTCTQTRAGRTPLILVHVCAVLEHQPYPTQDKSNPLPGGQLNRWRFQRLLMNFPLWQGASFRPVRATLCLASQSTRESGNPAFSPMREMKQEIYID